MVENFRTHKLATPLTEGTRGTGGRQGEPGIADFMAGTYPACSKHGALISIGGNKWRCLVSGCNVGVECNQANLRTAIEVELYGEEREYKSVKHKSSRTLEVTIERKGRAQPKPYNHERENR